MLKSIILTSLCLVLLMQPVSDLLIVLSYIVNKDFIASVLCINRDKLELGCEGKCQLSEQLKEKEKQENKGEGTISNKVDLVLFLPTSAEHLFSPIEVYKFHSKYNSTLSFVPPFPIFHPPEKYKFVNS